MLISYPLINDFYFLLNLSVLNRDSNTFFVSEEQIPASKMNTWNIVAACFVDDMKTSVKYLSTYLSSSSLDSDYFEGKALFHAFLNPKYQHTA